MARRPDAVAAWLAEAGVKRGDPVVLVDTLSGERLDGPGDGEICLDLAARPLPLMAGYLGDVARNADAMAGGFYHTGDVAAIDDAGYISYIGRTDDVFKASDYKISPFELESVLIEHPAVAEAAIVPAPDPVRLAVPKAYLVLVEGSSPDAATAERIFVFARERLAPWQRIRRLEFAELPKTILGQDPSRRTARPRERPRPRRRAPRRRVPRRRLHRLTGRGGASAASPRMAT